VGIIYITHKLEELDHIADDLAVLRDGRLITERPFKDVKHDEIIRMMVGREIGQAIRTPITQGPEVLSVRDISLAHPERSNDFAVRKVSFNLHHGEIVGVFGVLGAGRTELLQCLFGLYPHAYTGQMFVEGKPTTIRSPSDAIRVGIVLAP